MSLFFKKLLLITLLSGVVYIVLTMICSLVNHNFYSKHYNNIDTLILGDSHVKFLNEKVISNSLNLYRGGQSYKESYFKLKYFNEINNFQKVILSFSPHNFSSLAEYKINEDYHSVHSISTISSLKEIYYSTKSIDSFVKVFFGYFANARFKPQVLSLFKCEIDLKSELDQDLTYRTIEELKKIKSKRKLRKSELNTVKRIRKHFFYNKIADQSSNSSKLYFDEIVQYCIQHNIELTLINMPVHPEYRKQIPEYHWKHFQKLCKEIRQIQGVVFIDLLRKYDNRLKYFNDVDHCNELAGALISKEYF